MESSARISCDLNHSQNWTWRSVSSPCNSCTKFISYGWSLWRWITRCTRVFGCRPTNSDAIFLYNRCGLNPIVGCTAFIITWILRANSLCVVRNFLGLLDSVTTSTNSTMCMSWPVRMMMVKFFSCMSLAKARGLQEKNVCLLLSSVRLIYVIHYMLLYLE
jgi:hypothetical protein